MKKLDVLYCQIENNSNPTANNNYNNFAINRIIKFLTLFMSTTIAKRIIVMIFIVAGLNDKLISCMTLVCPRSVHSLRKKLASGDIDNIFEFKVKGRKKKLAYVEQDIIDEIKKIITTV